MLAPRLARALRPLTASSISPLSTLKAALLPALPALQSQQTRHASHATSGRANKVKDGPGKRLGAKKTAGEKVKVGMIIFRQRGTQWFPGENAGMGRDHTIFANAPGYVRYYKDPAHPKRKFIGIALTPNQKLPKPPNAARVRKLGRELVPLQEKPELVPYGTSLAFSDLKAKDGSYAYRPANWRIGRIMPKVEVKERSPFSKWQRKVRRRAARNK